MSLNAHPISAMMNLSRAWIPYRETESKMKTHLQSCIRSNASPYFLVQQPISAVEQMSLLIRGKGGHFVVACPSKWALEVTGVSLCWHYDVCVVLDGNTLVAEQLSCIW